MGKHNPETGVGRRGENGNEIWGADDEEEEEGERECRRGLKGKEDPYRKQKSASFSLLLFNIILKCLHGPFCPENQVFPLKTLDIFSGRKEEGVEEDGRGGDVGTLQPLLFSLFLFFSFSFCGRGRESRSSSWVVPRPHNRDAQPSVLYRRPNRRGQKPKMTTAKGPGS